MIKNILLLDSEGKRVAVKYYSDDWPTNNSKLAFEKFVFSKTVKTNARTEGKHYSLTTISMKSFCFVLGARGGHINLIMFFYVIKFLVIV